MANPSIGAFAQQIPTLVTSKEYFPETINNDNTLTFDRTPDAGNLLITTVTTTDNNAWPWDITGWTVIDRGHPGNQTSGAIAWKISNGTETGVEWTSALGDTGEHLWYGEFTGIDGTAPEVDIIFSDSAFDDVNTLSSGTTSAVSKDSFAIALFFCDSVNIGVTTRTYTNGFEVISERTDNAFSNVIYKNGIKTGEVVETTLTRDGIATEHVSITLVWAQGTGTQANSYTLDAEASTSAIAGQDATLTRTYSINSEAATTSVIGSDADLDRDHSQLYQPGTISVTGSDVTLTRTYSLNAESTITSVTGSDAELTVTSAGLIYNATIGTGGNYQTVEDWSTAIIAEGSLTNNVLGTLIENKEYLSTDAQALNFTGKLSFNGFSIVLDSDPSVRHNGVLDSGASLTSNVVGFVYEVEACTVKNVEFKPSTGYTGGGTILKAEISGIIENCIIKGKASNNADDIDLSSGAEMYNCLIMSGSGTSDGVLLRGSSIMENCTVINGDYAVNGDFSEFIGTLRNCVFYGQNQTNPVDLNGFTWSGATISNLASDGTLTIGTNNVSLSDDPFVDSASGNYRPVRNGQLDNAGIATSLVTDIVGEVLDERQPIGAFEDDSGIKDIGTTGSFSTYITNVPDYIQTVGTLVRDLEFRFIDDTTYTVPTDAGRYSVNDGLNYNGFTITHRGFGNGKPVNGTYSGARLGAADGTRVFRAESNTIWEDLCATNYTLADANAKIIDSSTDATFNRVYFLYQPTIANTSPIITTLGGANYSACIIIGNANNHGVELQGPGNLINCTILNTGTGVRTVTSHTGICQNNVVYNCVIDYSNTGTLSGTYDNNAGEDAISSVPTEIQNGYVQITSADFVDSASDNYRPKEGSGLALAGATTGITTDIEGRTFPGTLPIGAFKAGATYSKELRASAGDYTSFSDWVADFGGADSGNIAQNGDNLVLTCYKGDYTAFGGGLNFLDDSIQFQNEIWTTSPETRIRVIVPETERHNGIPGTGFYIQDTTNWSVSVYHEVNNIDIIGMDVLRDNNVSGGYTFRSNAAPSNGTTNITDCIFRRTDNNYDNVYAVAYNTTFTNCLFINGLTGIRGTAYRPLTLENCTIVNCITGVINTSIEEGSPLLKNVAIYGCTTDFDNNSNPVWNASSSHVAAETALASVPANLQTNYIQLTADPFEDSANSDYRPVYGGQLDGAAVDEHYDFEDGTLQGWTKSEPWPSELVGSIDNTSGLGGSNYGILVEAIDSTSTNRYIRFDKTLGQTYSDIYLRFKTKFNWAANNDTRGFDLLSFRNGTTIIGSLNIDSGNDGDYNNYNLSYNGGADYVINSNQEYTFVVRFVQSVIGGMQVWVDDSDTPIIDDLTVDTSASGINNIVVGEVLTTGSGSLNIGSTIIFDTISVDDNYISNSNIGALETAPYTLVLQDLNAESGSININGQDANLIRTYSFNAESSTTSITGSDATLQKVGSAYGTTLTIPTIVGTHTDFPVLIKETDLPVEMINGGPSSLADGGGELKAYTDSNKTTQLPIQVVEFTTGVTPSVQIWVKRTISTGSTIYLEKDQVQIVQPAADSTYGSQAVWSDACFRLHLKDSNSPIVDASGNNVFTEQINASGTLTYNSQNGKIGDAVDIELAGFQTTTAPINFTSGSSWRYTFWGSLQGGSSYATVFRCNNVSTFKLLRNSNTSDILFRQPNGFLAENNLVGAWAALQGQGLKKVDFVREGTTLHMYINGVEFTSITLARSDANTMPNPLQLGYEVGTNNHMEVQGYDEVGLDNTSRSANWIATEYFNQNTSAWLSNDGWSAGGSYSIDAQSSITSITGSDTGLTRTYSLNAEPTTTSVTGQDSALRKGYKVQAISGTTTINGEDAILRKGYSVVVVPESIDVTGTDLILRNNSSIPAESGLFDISGADVNTTVGYVISADSGGIGNIGQSALLIYGSETKILAEGGTVSSTGQDATLLRSRIFNAESGSISTTGQDSNLLYGFNTSFTAETGTSTVNGQDANLLYGFNTSISADPGAVNITGQDAELVYGSAIVLNAESGSIVTSGQTANLIKTNELTLGSATISISEQDSILRKSYSVLAEAVSIAITGVDSVLGETTGQRLLRYSSLSSPNTALQHFLNINYGTGGGQLEIIETDKIEAIVTEDVITAVIEEDIITATITEDIITATVIEEDLGAIVSDDNLTGSIGE